ncbi:MAG: MBL fold metallo-hydrolase [Planctomycetes bacterium]|nr:MBL fold metallo-hydrolase [Planctomycetota bacterium]
MEIQSFVLGPLEVSAYVVIEGGEAIIVDAPAGAEAMVALLDERGIVPKILVNTHGHADHIQGNRLLKGTWPAMTLAIGEADARLLAHPLKNLSPLLGAWVKSPEADRLLADGDTVTVGGAAFEVLATPGHSKGSVSLYCPAGPDGRGVVFCGDVLFAGGIGRSDLPGMSSEALMTSIRTRLLALPAETVVYPGHGPASTIGREAKTNPWL